MPTRIRRMLPALAERLLHNNIPAWLSPVPLDEASDILLFRVKPH